VHPCTSRHRAFSAIPGLHGLHGISISMCKKKPRPGPGFDFS